MKKIRMFASVNLMACLVLMACGSGTGDVSLFPDDSGSAEKGSLVLNLSMLNIEPVSAPTLSLASASILPSIPMEPVSYEITGSGPEGAAFSLSSDNDTVVIQDIVFGEWSIGVVARNVNGTEIGSGVGIVTVSAGIVATLEIGVRPFEGPGSLELTVEWRGITVSPGIEAELIPSAGSPITIPFAIEEGANRATYASDPDSIESGYYTLIVRLYDQNVLVMGAADVVRIVRGELTSGSLSFEEINSTGGIQINITPDLYEPIDVAIYGITNNQTMIQGDIYACTASASNADGVIFSWFINGRLAGTGAALSIGRDLTPGTYRLDVTAFSTDGKRAGSATISFRVARTEYMIIWDAGSDGIFDTPDDVPEGYYAFEYNQPVTMMKSYNAPGGNGAWLDSDDVFGNIYMIQVCMEDGTEGSAYFEGPGPDNVWFNNDDTLAVYYQPARTRSINSKMDMAGIYKERWIFSDPGDDGEWFSSNYDDTVVSYGWLMTDGNGNPSYSLHSDGKGDDGVWGTGDDNIIAYNSYTVDARGNPLADIYYNSPGADMDWSTSEDNSIGMIGTHEYDETGKMTRDVTYMGAGPDGIPLNSDDNLMFYADYIYNEDGTIIALSMSFPGDDGIGFNEDDEILIYITYVYED